LLINEGYFLFEVKSGELAYLENMNIKDARIAIQKNENTRRFQEKEMGSEVLIKRDNKWTLEKRKRVLYFDIITEHTGALNCTLAADSDTLTLKMHKYKEFAKSHYFVLNYKNVNGTLERQRVFNHVGIDITDKLQLKDPAKRILLFVNGYRPTSLGNTFEENFDDIKNNGLEFRNSRNLIYTFDRYDYWRPWKEIDWLFQRRINPTDTYYADGHHSVTTSNHRSLIDFTTLSTTYPKRCKDPNHHVCQDSEKGIPWLGLTRDVETVSLFNLKPNKRGFKERLNSGRIAGRNIEQMFNEIPNMSENDTLYIVAHSMGYAYALGIIEKMRGKINFGGLYIIAPENGKAGTVNTDEWQEVWQYGSNFELHKDDAPCLLDGIAPQTKVGGLSERQRAYIPEDLYKRMGFFESHFVGNYTWIFDIPSGESGYIQQH
jgi:hypothetical protein